MSYQTPKTVKPSRSDHIWVRVDKLFKCVLCGGVTRSPPDFPTPREWMPDRYYPLTPDERSMLPYLG